MIPRFVFRNEIRGSRPNPGPRDNRRFDCRRSLGFGRLFFQLKRLKVRNFRILKSLHTNCWFFCLWGFLSGCHSTAKSGILYFELSNDVLKLFYIFTRRKTICLNGLHADSNSKNQTFLKISLETKK